MKRARRKQMWCKCKYGRLGTDVSLSCDLLDGVRGDLDILMGNVY